jgi:hypothetical protein
MIFQIYSAGTKEQQSNAPFNQLFSRLLTDKWRTPTTSREPRPAWSPAAVARSSTRQQWRVGSDEAIVDGGAACVVDYIEKKIKKPLRWLQKLAATANKSQITHQWAVVHAAEAEMVLTLCPHANLFLLMCGGDGMHRRRPARRQGHAHLLLCEQRDTQTSACQPPSPWTTRWADIGQRVVRDTPTSVSAEDEPRSRPARGRGHAHLLLRGWRAREQGSRG